MKYSDRFHLTPEQSLFLAKKKWDENVYCGMKMENRAVTFPQTKTILNGVNVPNVQLDDIQAILNMRDAWKYLLSSIDEPVTLDYICKLNEYIARNEALEWGKLRTGTVGISGTDYEPPIPQQKDVMQELSAILNSDTTATEKALNVFVWGARGQFFWDGNKRTSLTVANKILIAAGAGILTISDKHMEQFNTLLLDYYNTGNSKALKEFLYENAIQGITMYNPQSYAISIERLLKASTHSADTIRKNPLAYVSSYLDSLSEQSEDKRQLVFDFDDKYEKYKNVSLDRWEETDVAQMLKDLRELIK